MLGSKKRKVENLDRLSEELRNCCRERTLVDYINKPIYPLEIEFGDSIVIKCHVRY